MKLKNSVCILAILIMMIAGCSNNKPVKQSVHTTQNPDAHEMLALQPDADIFQWDNLIYSTDVDWVEELELTKNIQIGEITNNATNPDEFTNGTANKLPVGAILFSVKEDGGFLLVEHDGKLKKYMPVVEG